VPVPDFANVERRLLSAGTAPSVAQRMREELEDHYADLVEAARAEGHSVDSARVCANALLGDLEVLVHDAAGRPELKSWAWRWPRLASTVYPVAYVLALPAVPIAAGVAHAPAIFRWAGCMLAGALVTAAIFLGLQFAILFS